MRRLTSFLIAVGLLGIPHLATPGERADRDRGQVTRILYLTNIESVEAFSLLRGQLVRNMADAREIGAIIVKSTPDSVRRSERLLLERDVLVRSVEPHGPLDVEPQGETGTLTLRVEGVTPELTLGILRAIYHVRDIERPGDDRTFVIHAAEPTLAASRALLSSIATVTEE